MDWKTTARPALDPWNRGLKGPDRSAMKARTAAAWQWKEAARQTPTGVKFEIGAACLATYDEARQVLGDPPGDYFRRQIETGAKFGALARAA